MIEVSVNNSTSFLADAGLLQNAVRNVLSDHGVAAGEVSIAIVDDKTMHQLNRQHLQHDYPTDVLSFLLDADGDYLEGEVIVSADTATTVAATCEWPAQSELLLYLVHGTLHLVGHDDHEDQGRAEMRRLEILHLQRLDVECPDSAFDGRVAIPVEQERQS